MTIHQDTPAVGIDIAKLTFEAALLRDGRRTLHRQFDNTPQGWSQLAQWLSRHDHAEAPIGMEATGHYGKRLLHYLHDAGHHVSELNPAQVKHFAAARLTRNKTDRVDAAVIADFVATMKPRRTHPASAHKACVRRLCHERRKTVGMLTQVRNALKATPDSEHFCELKAYLEESLSKLERRIQEQVEATPEFVEQVRCISAIQGVSQVTSISLVAMVDFERFANVKQFSAYLGLTPRVRTSGTSLQGRSRLSKTGNSELRSLLYLCALNARQHNPELRACSERWEKQGLCGKRLICALAHKLARIIYGCVKSGQPPHYRVVEGAA